MFSSATFHDPQLACSSELTFVGIPIGPQEALPQGLYTPRVSLANFSSTPLTASFALADTLSSPAKESDGHIRSPRLSNIGHLTIPAFATGEFVFIGQEAQSGLLHSIVLSASAQPGTYQAQLVSLSTGSLSRVELLTKEILE